METLQRTANRGSISTGFDIDNSLKFESDNSERMSFTPASAVASERRKHTISFWIKRTELGSTQYIYEWGGSEGDYLRNFLRFQSDDTLRYATSYNTIINTTRVFRDTSAWYHIVIQTDTVQSSNSDTKFWMYVNGELEGSFTGFNVNDTMAFANNSQHDIGFTSVDNGAYGNYYLAEFNAVGGLKLAPTEFGEFDEDSGIWKPKAYTGSYGTNGFYLDFSDSANLGDDASGNGNNFTLTNITSADQATDTPTNNFCTMNPLLQNPSAITPMTEGATFITGYISSTNWESRFGTVPVTGGKWYTELKADGAKYTNNIFVGYCGTEYTNNHYNNHLVFNGAEGALAIYSFNGDIYGGTGVHGFRIYDGDIVAMMLDADNGAMYFKRLAGPNSDASEGTITWSRDGTNTADPTSGASKTGAQIVDWDGATIVAVSVGNNVGGIEMNFGGYNIISNTQSYTDENGYGSFVMQPPTGYYALCTKNLAEYG